MQFLIILLSRICLQSLSSQERATYKEYNSQVSSWLIQLSLVLCLKWYGS